MGSNSYNGVEQVVSRLAATIALVVVLALPIAFLVNEINEAGNNLQAEARLQASAMTAFVGRNPTVWELPTDRLRAVLEQNSTLGADTRIVDARGQRVLHVEAHTEWPVLVRRAVFFDFGRPVGAVEVAISIRGILFKTIAVLGASVTLGLLIYGPMRRIPMNAFRGAMRELETSEARYRRLVERAPVGIVKHRHGFIEFANPAFANMVGAESADELGGRDILGFVVPEHRGEAAHMIAALSGGATFVPFRRQNLLRRDNGVVETEMAGVSNREGDAWVGQVIVVDVTEQRRAQELVRRSRDQLLEQQHALTALTRSDIFAAGDCDVAVRSITEVAAEQLGVERVSLWRFTPARDALQCVELYERNLHRHGGGPMFPVRLHPRFVEAIASEEVIVADDALGDELTSELAQAYLAPLSIGSILGVPIRLRGVPDGVLCHEHVGPPISWSPEQRMFAIAIGNLVALVLEREHVSASARS
jgi:PAS domain S-box-containing protein